jgi:hypothetical protein
MHSGGGKPLNWSIEGYAMSRGDELIDALSGGGALDADAVANELLGEFGAGYPVERLHRLLRSGVAAAVRAGVWIASELGEHARPLLGEMPRLLRHPVRSVRFFAIDVVLVTATGEDGEVVARAVDLIADPDGAVRWKAMRLLANASGEQLAASVPYLRDEGLRELTAWIGHADDPADILSRFAAGDRTIRLFAAAAAARVAGTDRAPLERIADSGDEETASFARERLELLAPRRRR